MTQTHVTAPFDLTPFRGEYPWQSRWFTLPDGLRMHHLDEGHGDALVMVHGNPTWSFYWRHLVTALSADHRIIVPDHIGCGLSDKPGDDRYPYVLERRVEDLTALLDHLGLTRNITLVAHDWGGMIALTYAVRHPERVARIVLMNTAGFGLPAGSPLPWQLKLARTTRLSDVLIRGANAFVRGAARTCTVRPGRMTPILRAAYAAPYDSWEHRIAVQRFVEDIPLEPGHPSWDVLEEVGKKLALLRGKPALLFWGERDFVFTPAFLAEWRRRWPEAEVMSFPDAGHYVLEDAHEQIVPRLRVFLRAHPITTADA